MIRPIAVVLEIDTDKYPDYLSGLPDFLELAISKADEKEPPRALTTDMLCCYQFPEGWDQDRVEDYINEVCQPWVDPNEKDEETEP